MSDLDNFDKLFIVTAFSFQVMLIAFFALRKRRYETAIRIGPLVYAFGILAAIISLILLLGGKPWYIWLGGFLYLVYAIYGYTVEYVRGVEWRSPPYWPVMGPYVTLYLATVMFYWWPLGSLGTVGRPLWFAYAVLFVISTILNVTSHR